MFGVNKLICLQVDSKWTSARFKFVYIRGWSCDILIISHYSHLGFYLFTIKTEYVWVFRIKMPRGISNGSRFFYCPNVSDIPGHRLEFPGPHTSSCSPHRPHQFRYPDSVGTQIFTAFREEKCLFILTFNMYTIISLPEYFRYLLIS